MVGLHHSDLRIFAGKEAVEIGWRLRKEFWNRGYETEAVQACLDFAFQQAGLSEVYSFTSLYNLPSQKVMQKLGMEFVKEFDEIMLIGGGELFKQYLPKADKLYLTQIQADIDGDTFFPEINWSEWNIEFEEYRQADEDNLYDCRFLILQRKA